MEEKRMVEVGVEKSKQDLMQEDILEKWVESGMISSVHAATGVGKTRIAQLVVEYILKLDPSNKVIVIVPTLLLQNQWRELFASYTNLQVLVINSIALQDRLYETDLLILDEYHRYLSEQFITVVDKVRYKYRLDLSATGERLDGREELFRCYVPIIATVTMDEARREGYVADFTEYNLGLDLTRAEKKELDRINQIYNTAFGWFNWDFKLAMACMTKYHKTYAEENKIDPKLVMIKAVQFNRSMMERKKMFYNSDSKLDMTQRIIDKFSDKRIITFSESVMFADQITALNDDSRSYHSGLQKREIDGKKYTPAKLNELYLNQFKSGEVRILNTAKALNEGFDSPKVEIGIICSGNSSRTSHVQRVGRICRKFQYDDGTWKKPSIINLFIKGEQDEKWLKSSQKGSRGIINCKTITDLFSHIDDVR